MINLLANKLGLEITQDNLPVRAEQMRTLVNGYPSNISVSMILALLVVWLMWPKVDHVDLLVWLAALYAFHTQEFWYWRNYPKKVHCIEECKLWQNQFLLSDILGGVIWGSAGWFMFVQGDPLYQAIILAVMMGLASGAVASNLAFPLSQQTYVALVILPVFLNILYQGAREYYLLAAMVGLFLIFIMKVGREQGRFFEKSIRSWLENAELTARLRESEQSLRESQVIAGLGSYVLDIPSGKWESSGMLDQLFGIDASYEHTLDGWMNMLHPDDRAMMNHYLRSEVGVQGKAFEKEFRIIRCNDHAERWIYGLGKLSCDAQGRPLKLHGTVQDITERKRAEKEINELAFYDSLTKLPNRRMLNDRLSQAKAAGKRTGLFCALMFLDLDNFKSLNDEHGHGMGDLLLVEVACRLAACVRESDTVARFGGDEFVVMLNGLSRDKEESAAQAGIVAQKIRTSLAKPYFLKNEHDKSAATTVEHHCAASIGVVVFDGETDIEDMLKWADRAMYQAKESGRNIIRFHEANMQAGISRK